MKLVDTLLLQVLDQFADSLATFAIHPALDVKLTIGRTYQVFLAGQFESAHLNGLEPFVVDGLGGCEAKPRARVAAGKRPNSRDNFLCPFHSADGLSSHRMTNGCVRALHGLVYTHGYL